MNISPEWPASNVPGMGEEGVAYQKGVTVTELITLMRSPGARPLGGGTDLLPSIRERIVAASVLIDLCAAAELSGFAWKEDGSLVIGATTTLAAIEKDQRVRHAFPALSNACAAVASPAIRNVGTLGGNLCQRPRCWYFRQRLPCHKHGGSFCFAHDGENEYHAIFGSGPCYIVHPSDVAVALMALDATVHVASAAGERRIPIDKFFVLPADRIDLEHVLQAGEIVRAVELPAHAAGGRQRFEKVMQREAWDFAVVSIAAARWPDDRVRLVLGGVAPIPWRIRSSIEEDVTSGALSADDIDTLAERAMYDAQPLAKNGYKVDIALALLRRAITELSANP